jgi:hypothetical protein
MNPVWKLKKILFNIEGYGEFFSVIILYKVIFQYLSKPKGIISKWLIKLLP